jgi:glucosamine--fructose-6-phosphate aminotransferase (isomerizing)
MSEPAPTMTTMRAEIEDVPRAVGDLLSLVSSEALPAASAFRERRPGWLSIVARGTSDHAAIYARYLAETSLGLPTGLAAPSVVTTYRAPLRWAGGALLAISQSGQSPDVVEVVAAARAGRALTVAVTNDPRSPLAAEAEHVILCHAGAEAAVPATKTYVTELVAIASLIAAIGDDRLGRSLAPLPVILEGVLRASGDWLAEQPSDDSVVSAIASAGRALVVSRGFNLATAFETALKLKETAGVFAEPYSAADLLHGPLILAGRDVPTIIIRPNGPIAESIDAAAESVRDRGGRTWQIAFGGFHGPMAVALPGDLPEALTPIAYVLPAYLIAEAVARQRGLDPDAPQGLTKVTHTH